MNKFLLFIIILILSPSISQAQTYNDGCMNMSVKAIWSWNEEYEDPFANDESSWQWYIADNANIDGAGYLGGGCLQQGGSFQIGWWNHSDYTMNNFSYGVLNSPNAATVPAYLNLRGRYEGDDCGGNCDHNNGGIFTCFGDQDDYIFNDLVSSFIDYRFAAPNSDNVFQRFTNWHGSADYGGEFTVNYTSPRPNTATTSYSTICDDGSSGAVTLTSTGAEFGGSYEWYVGAAFDYVGSGSSIMVDPILDANGGTSVVYHVYTKNGSLNSLCYKDITIDIVNCDFNCTSAQNTTSKTITPFTNGFNFGNVTTSGYPAGSYITDVNVSTSFIKNNPNNDIGFELIASASGLSCTSTSLVNEQFAGNGQALASVLFDEQSSNSVISGTFDPQFTSVMDPTDDLSCYNWFSPNRNWNLRVDHSGSSTFQVTEFDVEVCACKPATSASITESGTNAITLCETQGGTLELNVSGSLGAIDAGGFGDEVRWFQDVCYTGPFVGSGNPFTITAPTIPGTYTYYANYYVDGVACDIPSMIADECQSITITVSAEPVAGAVVQGGNIIIDICENTSPGLFTLVGSNQSTPGVNIARWESSTDGGINWSPIVNLLPTYNPGTLSTVGIYYYRAVLSNLGCGDTYSDFIIVNVFETPDAGSTALLTTGNTYCSDTIFRMSTSGYSGALQWQISSDNGLSYSDIPGQSSDDLTYLVTNTTELPIDYLFRVKASNLPCADYFSSPAEAITIYPATLGGTLTASQDVCLNGFAADLNLINVHGDSIIWEMDDNIAFSSPTDLAHVQKVIGLDNILTSATMGIISSTQYVRARVINDYCTEAVSNTITLTSYTPPTNSISANQNLCVGDVPDVLMGSLPTGGIGTFAFQWQSSPMGSGSWTDIGGATAQNYNPVSYTTNTDFRRVVSSGPCDSISPKVTVVYNVNPSYTSITPSNITCYGADNGSISILALNTDSFSIDNGMNYSFSGSFTNLAAGFYNIVIKNTNDCSLAYGANPVEIVEPLEISFTTINVDPSCSNTSNGSITINTTNGVGVLNYSLNGGGTQTGNTFSGLSAGTYNILVSDAGSCSDTASVTLTDSYTLTLNLDSVINTSCFGQADGSLHIGTSGGQSPFTFSVDGVNYQPDSVFTGLASGLYTVYTADNNGCVASSSATISESPQLLIVLDSVNNVLCNGQSTGAAYIWVSGGTGVYTYLWSNGAMTQDLENAPEGSYNVLVSSGACSASLNLTINEPTILAANLVSVNDVSCNGGTNGVVDVSVSGGTTPYSYLWSNGDTIEDLFGVIAGSYSLTVTDANNCTSVINATIGQSTTLTIVGSGTNSSCSNSADGNVSIAVTGGLSPYQYSLNGGPAQSSNSFTGLSAAFYILSVTDVNGCSAAGNALVLNDYTLTLSTASFTNVSCAGQNDGQVQLTTAGGQSPFSFTINGALVQTDSLFANLSAGFYTFEVTDANGCSSSVSTTISENAPMVLSLDSVSNVLCTGDATGAAYISVNGGDGSYMYAWTGAGTSTMEDITNAVAGSYNVSVIDGVGCSATLSVTIFSPFALSAAISNVNHVSCNGESDGSIDVSIAGGTPNYTFSWSDGTSVVGISEDLSGVGVGNYTLTVTDDNGCDVVISQSITENTLLSGTISSIDALCFDEEGTANVSVNGGVTPYQYLWSNFDTASNAMALSEGMISVIVTDQSGCTIQLFDTIHVPTAPISISALVQNVSCFGLSDGSIAESVSGGTGTYTITYSPGGSNSNLTAGVYTVNVLDANGCSASESYTIIEPNQILTSLSVTNPSCFGEQTGMAVAGATNGTAPYTFSWNTTPIQVGIVAVNLLGDVDYVVTVADVNGCIAFDTARVVNPVEIVLNTIPTSVSCISNANGEVVVQAQGGNLPYEYQLNGFLQADSVFENLTAGNYIVFVTDNTNCSASSSFTVSSASSMQAEIEAAGNDMNYMTDQLHIVSGEEVNLNVNFINDAGNTIVGYNWIPTEIDTIRNPSFFPTDDITVQVEVLEMINGNICSVFDTLQINVSQESLIFIPTAFSPNNAGQNNFFEMNVLGGENLNVQIFNRWGEEVFSNPAQGNGPNNVNDASLTDGTNPRNAWDGKYNEIDVPTGSYVYKVEVTYFDGGTKLIKGSVTVIR